jgi:hypothetical protein
VADLLDDDDGIGLKHRVISLFIFVRIIHVDRERASVREARKEKSSRCRGRTMGGHERFETDKSARPCKLLLRRDAELDDEVGAGCDFRQIEIQIFSYLRSGSSGCISSGAGKRTCRVARAKFYFYFDERKSFRVGHSWRSGNDRSE